MTRGLLAGIALVVALATGLRAQDSPPTLAPDPALVSITAADIEAHLRTLANNNMKGRNANRGVASVALAGTLTAT